MNFVQSNQIKPKATFSVILYGATGIGKTTLALSSYSPALIDLDGGVTRVDAKFTSGALVAQVDEWEGYNKMVTELSQLPSQTLIIDTASKMNDKVQHYVMTSPAFNYCKKSLTKPTLQAYGDIKRERTGFTKGINQLGKDIILIAQQTEMTITTPKGDVRYYLPDCGGDKQRTEWFQDADLVGWMFKDGDKTCVTFDPTESYYGKNTCGLDHIYELPNLEDGTMNTFMQTIKDKYIAHQEQNISEAAAYHKQITDLTAMVSRIDDADKANKFVAYAAKIKWLLDAKVKVINAFEARVTELGLTKEGKAYV